MHESATYEVSCPYCCLIQPTLQVRPTLCRCESRDIWDEGCHMRKSGVWVISSVKEHDSSNTRCLILCVREGTLYSLGIVNFVMLRIFESCHMWMSRVTYEQVMTHISESCRGALAPFAHLRTHADGYIYIHVYMYIYIYMCVCIWICIYTYG